MITRVRVVNALGNFYSSETEHPQLEDMTAAVSGRLENVIRMIDKGLSLDLPTDKGWMVIGPELLKNSIIYVEEMGE